MKEALDCGSSHFEKQLQAAVKDAVVNEIHGERMSDLVQRDRILEYAFMWGWYHEYAKAAGEWPATPSMRATLHMIEHLMKRSGFSFKDARAEASALDAMWNEADPLCDAVIKCGAKSFHQPDHAWYSYVLRKFAEQP